jgi:hypothetical protein
MTEQSSNDERLRTAIHEAAHAVIGERLGVRVDGIISEPAKHGHYAGVSAMGHTQFEPHPIVTGTEMIISLAGCLAETRMFGHYTEIASRGDMDTMRMIMWRAVWAYRRLPEPTSAAVLDAVAKGQVPREVEGAVQKLSAMKNQETINMLADPQTWAQIQAVAEALLAKGNLSGDEVRQIMEQCVKQSSSSEPSDEIHEDPPPS